MNEAEEAWLNQIKKACVEREFLSTNQLCQVVSNHSQIPSPSGGSHVQVIGLLVPMPIPYHSYINS